MADLAREVRSWRQQEAEMQADKGASPDMARVLEQAGHKGLPDRQRGSDQAGPSSPPGSAHGHSEKPAAAALGRPSHDIARGYERAAGRRGSPPGPEQRRSEQAVEPGPAPHRLSQGSRGSSLNGSTDGLLASESSSKMCIGETPSFPARRRGMSERDDEFAKRTHEALLQKKFGIAPAKTLDNAPEAREFRPLKSQPEDQAAEDMSLAQFFDSSAVDAKLAPELREPTPDNFYSNADALPEPARVIRNPPESKPLHLQRQAALTRDLEPPIRVRTLRQGGWLNIVDPSSSKDAFPPARTGTGSSCFCAPLPSSSCIPPPWDEPMQGGSTKENVFSMMLHDAERVNHPERVLNSLVYDSVDPSPNYDDDEADSEELPGGGFRPWHVLSHPKKDNTLIFESRFESGNLRRAIKVYDNEYDLILRPDINTKGHTQWFYFSVTNTRRGKPTKFNILNLMKDDSLYSEGMQPLIHSAKESVATGVGWHRSGTKIAYYQNNIKRKNGRFYYTLTFTIDFPHEHDVVHIAHCYPYTYSDLQRYLLSLLADPRMKNRVRRKPLCQTLAGNTCDMLTVTNFSDQSMSKRKGVVISGRVHPGETNASWMMKGVLDFITGSSLDAHVLRSNFVFKIVPMLNPDGVIVGNYRCSLAGVDLNRNWMEPSRKMHPTIYHTKMMMKKLTEDREVVLFCDLHGHSRKKDIFLYGCNKTPKDMGAPYPGAATPGSMGAYPGIAMRLQERLFPRMLHFNLPDTFSYKSSNFKVQKSKESTARIVCWRELGLVNAFTLEASFAGPSTGKNEGLHFNTAHLEEMGMALCRTLLDYVNPTNTFAMDVLKDLEVIHKGAGLSGFDGGEDDAPTDSDDEDSDDGGAAARQKAAAKPPLDLPKEPIEVPSVAEASSSADTGKSPMRGGNTKKSRRRQAQRRMKELELLSSEAASQFDILGLFQEKFGDDAGSSDSYGFLQDSGADNLKR